MSSFDYFETSLFEAKPRALYEFRFGPNVWRYASGEGDLVLPGLGTYASVAISDGGIAQTGNPQSDDVTVTLPRNTPVANLFATVPPSETVYLTMRRTNIGATEAPVVWIGTVKASKIVDLNSVEFTCLMIASSFDRQGLRLGWQRTCPHALYDRNCRVDPEAWAIQVPIESITGSEIYSSVISGLANARFTGGFVKWTTALGTIERRAIDEHQGSRFSILESTAGLQVGMTIAAYPGCPRNTDGCLSFNNLSNYGGFPHMPGQSPFDGNPVF